MPRLSNPEAREMVRKALVAIVAVFALAASSGPAIERTAVAFQSAEDGVSAFAPVELALGEAASFSNADLTVEDVLVAPAFDAEAFSDVRVSVVMRNTGPEPIPYSANAFLVDSTFPVLTLRDGADVAHEIDTDHLARAAVPGSDLAVIESGMAARWTFGYRVPDSAVNRLALDASIAGTAVATWDLSTPAAATGLPAPTVETAAFDRPVSWSDDLEITAREVGELVCGDPSIEPIVHIVTVTFDVTNRAGTALEWPGVLEPGTPAVAQWSDGTAAEAAFETYVGDAETLLRASGRGSFIPPGTTQQRALVFAAPRDGRFTDLDTLPAGLLLTPQTGERMWLTMEGASATIGVSPQMCYLGVTGGPSPYSFTPPASFTPFPLEGAALALVQDTAATRLLQIATAGASLYFDANAKTFKTMTAAALAGYTPGIAVVAYDVTTELTGGVDVVYFDVDPDRPDFLFVMTQSSSGTWFCEGVLARQLSVAGTAPTSLEAAAQCWPEAFEEEAAG